MQLMTIAACSPPVASGLTSVEADGNPAAAGPVRVLEPEALGDHIDRLHRAALSLCRSREEAEDLVQDTLARVLRKPRFLQAGDDLSYLLSVLRNTFFTGKRNAARRPRTTALPDSFEALEDPREQPPDRRLESREVYGVIARLPDRFRDALIAVDVAGLSYREAARSLGVCEATLTTRLYRARQRVARELTSGQVPTTQRS